ncbi:OsmC family protein [Paenibacillus yanchengensis]|uniref:OsmC family protein n=1 Tax=Paenibacillus yanchengensis TaxID=2035833 RepID=A0ABW4YI67_9BACL
MANVQTFKATAHLQEGVQVVAKARQFTMTLDEPPALGGKDTGMNPVEAVLVALGACQAIVARVYAPKFGVELEDFQVDVEGEVDFDGFFGKSDVRPGYSDIRYVFRIKTDSPQEQVEQFVAHLESKCPVGDSLANNVNLKLDRIEVIRPTHSTTE